MFKVDTKRLIFSSLFTSLIIVGGFISVPIGIIPGVLSDFFVIISSSLQGPLASFISIIFYLFLGIIGLPVFANGNSGFGVFTSPTSGFLIGFLFISIFISLFLYDKDNKKVGRLRYFLCMVIANIILYTCGVVGIMLSTSLSFFKSLLAISIFIPGAILKSFVAYFVYKRVNIWQN